MLEGQDAVRDDYPEAVWLSAEVLQRVRAGQAPEAVAHAFAGTRSLLGEFFPGQTDEVMRSAAALTAANRSRPLAEQRIRLGLTQAQVARRMGVRQERVSAIERAEPGATEVRTLASYVEALGGPGESSPTSAAIASCSADQPRRPPPGSPGADRYPGFLTGSCNQLSRVAGAGRGSDLA